MHSPARPIQRKVHRGHAAFVAHQFRHCKRGNQSGSGTADGDFVGDDEMLEVDKGRGDEERDENPIGDCERPRKSIPDDKEEESS